MSNMIKVLIMVAINILIWSKVSDLADKDGAVVEKPLIENYINGER